MSAKRSQSQAAPRPQKLKRARWLAVLLAALGLLAVVAVGCGSSDDSSDTTGGETSAASEEETSSEPSFTIGWMLPNETNEFLVQQKKDLEEIFPKYGADVVFLNTKEDPTTQLQGAQNWLNTGQVDAIAGTLIDANAFQPALDQAADQGVPVVQFTQLEKYLTGEAVIEQDWVKWGEIGGEAMGKCLNERYDGKGEVLLLTGPNFPGMVIKGREIGLKKALEATAPEADIVAEVPGENDRLKGLQSTQTTLQAHPDLVGVMSIGDESQLGAMQAFKAAGKNPSELCIIGMDNGEEAHEAFENGEFYSEIDLGLQKIYEKFGEVLKALNENPEDPRFNEKVLEIDTFTPLYN